MSALAEVDQVSVLWRVDRAELADPDRFDRLARALAGDALEAAVAEVDDPDRLLCIRRLVVAPIRVVADQADHEVLGLLGQAVAGALRETVARGGDDVVRYRSRAEARNEALVAVARGDRRRAWAWHQVGLWPVGEGPAGAGAAMVEVLGRDGGAVATVVADLLPAALDALVATLGPDQLARLVGLAWPEAEEASADPARLLGEAEIGDEQVRWAVRALGATVLGRRLLAGPAWPGPSLPALSVLAVLAAEPALVLAPPARVRGRLAAAMVLVLARAARAAAQRVQPDLGSADGVALRPEPAPGSADASTARPSPAVAAPTGSDRPADRDRSGLVVDGTDGVDPVADDGPVTPELGGGRRFVTDWAGLLFLLPLVERIGLVERLGAGRLSGVGLRPVLHQVGLALGRRLDPEAAHGPIDAADPALLVWCGLAPGQDPPDARSDLADADLTDADLVALADGEAERLVAALRQALEPDELAGVETPDLLASVVRRPATVVADPGWIDVHLHLDQVSTAVRRAGLDLDPGYRPWLGLVVRFLYG